MIGRFVVLGIILDSGEVIFAVEHLAIPDAIPFVWQPACEVCFSVVQLLTIPFHLSDEAQQTNRGIRSSVGTQLHFI